MLDPSDPTGASPVNRLVAISPSLEELVDRAMRSVWLQEDDRPLSSQVLELDEYADVWHDSDHRELYRTVYTLARTELALGESHNNVRVSLMKLTEERAEMFETIVAAIDDALAGRPPKW